MKTEEEELNKIINDERVGLQDTRLAQAELKGRQEATKEEEIEGILAQEKENSTIHIDKVREYLEKAIQEAQKFFIDAVEKLIEKYKKESYYRNNEKQFSIIEDLQELLKVLEEK